MKIYAIKKSDGGVAIMRTAANPADEIARMTPNMQATYAFPIVAREIAEADIPEDLAFREAWEDDGEKITVNVEKARAIFDDRIKRHKREKARELIERETAGEDVTAEKAALKAIDVDSHGARSVTDLKARWPQVLR